MGGEEGKKEGAGGGGKKGGGDKDGWTDTNACRFKENKGEDEVVIKNKRGNHFYKKKNIIII